MKRVKDIMTEHVVCCTPDSSLRDVARMLVDNDCGSLPVCETSNNHKLVGMITDRDIVCRTVALGRNPLEMKVRDCMSSPAVSVTPETTVEDCTNRMEERQVRRMPVVDANGCCCGIVAQADVAQKASARQTAETVKKISEPELAGTGVS